MRQESTCLNGEQASNEFELRRARSLYEGRVMDRKIEVFDFVYRDKLSGMYIRRASTMEWIVMMGCHPVPGSGRKVLAAHVAVDGILGPPKVSESLV